MESSSSMSGNMANVSTPTVATEAMINNQLSESLPIAGSPGDVPTPVIDPNPSVRARVSFGLVHTPAKLTIVEDDQAVSDAAELTPGPNKTTTWGACDLPRSDNEDGNGSGEGDVSQTTGKSGTGVRGILKGSHVGITNGESDEGRNNAPTSVENIGHITEESPFKVYRPPTPPSCERFSYPPESEAAISYRQRIPDSIVVTTTSQPVLPFFARLWAFIRRATPKSVQTSSSRTRSSTMSRSRRAFDSDRGSRPPSESAFLRGCSVGCNCVRCQGESMPSCLRSESDNSDRLRPIVFSEDEEVQAPVSASVTPRSIISDKAVHAVERFEYVLSCLSSSCERLAELDGFLPAPVLEGAIAALICEVDLSGPVPLLMPSEWYQFAAFLLLLVSERRLSVLPNEYRHWRPTEVLLCQLRRASGLSPEELASLVNLNAFGC